MTRLLLSVLLGCAVVGGVQAQENVYSASTAGSNAAANFSATSASRVPLIPPLAQANPLFTADAPDLRFSSTPAPATVTTALALPLAPPNAAAPEPSPEQSPNVIYSAR